MINSIIFDFGGVLGTDSDTIFFQTLEKYHIKRKIAIGIWEECWFELKTGKKHTSFIWDKVEKYTKHNMNKISKYYEKLISVDDEMLKLAKDLQSKGHHLGILANEALEWMDIKREKGKLDKIFDIIYSSADIGIPKPEKDAFKKILRSMNIKPASAIFIDNKESNTKAAEALGIKSILFSTIESLNLELQKLLDYRMS